MSNRSLEKKSVATKNLNKGHSAYVKDHMIFDKVLCTRKFFNKRLNVFCATLVAMGFLSQAHAADMRIDDFWVRDYLDLAQNRGQFTAGSRNVKVQLKDGTYFQFPDLPIPDFSPVANKGPTTSIGGAYTVSASHNIKMINGRPITHHAIYTQDWDQTQYTLVDKRDNGQDFAVHRLNKFVVETTGFTDSVDLSLNATQALERYGVDYNGKRQIIGFRVGSGSTNVTDSKNGKYETGASYEPDLLSGTMFRYDWKGYAYADFTKFNNLTKGGDSGSAFYLYDNVQKKWVVLGTLWGIHYNNLSNIKINLYDKNKVQELKNAYSQHVDLLNQTVKIDNQKLSFNNKDVNLEKIKTQLPQDPNNPRYVNNNKDLILTGGGTLVLTENVDLNAGGFIFDNKHYVLDSDSGSNYTFKGAGLDIAKNGLVDLNIETRDTLHKIGEGRLNVNVTQNNNYKTGNGTTYLNAQKSFNNIYMANGLSTVVVNHKDALNSNNAYNGVFFTRAGGVLDLNGYDHKFTKIAATDIGARVINSSDKKVDLHIKNNDKYAYHGVLAGNMDVYHSFDSKDDKRTLVLDGNVNLTGDIHVKNSSLVMQGHATTHAIFTSEGCKYYPLAPKCYKDEFKKREDDVNQQLGTDYKSNNKISSFNQPDWDNREFRFRNLNLDNAIFKQARNSVMVGNINASNKSEITLGSDTLYLDKDDGRNITGSGFSFKQELELGQAQGDSIFKGNVTLTDNSTLKVQNIFEGGISAKDSHVILNSEDIVLTYLDLDNSSLDFENKANVVVVGGVSTDKTVDLSSESTFVITGNNASERSLYSNDRVENTTSTIKDLQIKDKSKFAAVNNATLFSDVSVDGSASELLVSHNSNLDGSIKAVNNAEAKISEQSNFKGSIDAQSRSNVYVDSGSYAQGTINLGSEANLYIKDNAYFEGDIKSDNANVYLGAKTRSLTYSKNARDLQGYNSGVKGSVNISNGTFDMQNAVWIVDGTSHVDKLKTQDSLISSNKETGYKEINVAKLDSSNTTFALNTNLVNTDRLVVDEVLDTSSNNTIIINTEEQVEDGKELNIHVASIPKESKDKFNIASKVTGFSEIKPVTLIVESNSQDKEDVILSHYDIKPHQDTVANANNFMDTGYRNFVVEMNNLHKRMGDLRQSGGEAGAFARLMKGSGTGDRGYNDKYTHAQIGYDKRTRFDGFDIFNGVTLTYTDTNLNSSGFYGNTDSIGAGIYSAMLFDGGLYLDFIAKYVKHFNKITSEFASLGEQTFDNHSLYFGAEVGYKYNLNANTSITPQAELVYGHVSGSSITWEQGNIKRVLERKSYNPLVGRVGVDISHKMNFDDFSLTARAGTSAQFDMMKGSQTVLTDEFSHIRTDGDTDFRVIVNLGLDFALRQNFRMSIEYSKSNYGKYNIDDEINATARYIF